MNRKIAEAMMHCAKAGIAGAVFAVPFRLSLREVLELKASPACLGMILDKPPPELTADSTAYELGCFDGHGNWTLPKVRGPLILVGSHLMITPRMAARVLLSGRFSVLCRMDGQFRVLRLYRFILWRLGERIYQRARRLPPDGLVRRALFGVATLSPVKRLWSRVFERSGGPMPALGGAGLHGEALYAELLRKAAELPAEERIRPVPGRVLLVNAGLAAGGAERQIVNTLVGLRASGRCESAALLAEYIDHAPELDFFLHELEEKGIEVSQVRQVVTLAEDGLSSLPLPVAEIAADLPGAILEEVLNLVEEFRARRPEVVHAWQDSTSIKAGLAAAIAGVPRIVLASRNVTPVNFTYFEDYMYPAYRALAGQKHVTFLNNSEAGAADYTRWLGLPRERFVVVRNGVDLHELERAPGAAVEAYRRSLDIPGDAPVVGSVFRFWEEKRPLLWLETAARVHARFPEAHFLVVGEGPLRPAMESFLRRSGLERHVHLPGARPEVATPLSSMDVFLLTSKFEGTPNVVLEAQWLGLPVVATDAGGTREALRPGETGEVAANAVPDELATLVCGFLDSRERRARAGAVGRRHVEERFSVSRMIDETLSVYGVDPARVLP